MFKSKYSSEIQSFAKNQPSQLHCYPKEFIFAEKLETVIHRGSANSHMKDFHDLYYLVSFPEYLNTMGSCKNNIASIQKLPLHFDAIAKRRLQPLWQSYHQEIQPKILLPLSFGDVVSVINHWLESNTALCYS